jgi:ankyrin repeat protein
MAFALNGEGALWDAVTDGDVARVRNLLKRGADANMTCPDSFVRTEMAPRNTGTGRSLLHHAAFVGNLEVFRAIVEAGGDIDRRRNHAWRPNGGVRGRGNTPLHAAVM